MTIVGIDHVQLAMPPAREADARSFYGSLLGLGEIAKPPALASRGGCWFEHGDVRVHLGVEQDFRPARKAHPAFVVDDLAEVLDVLGHAGVPIGKDEPLDGCDRAFVEDPFGNRIELMQRKDVRG